MADALESGVPLSVLTCAAVAYSQLYIAMCLHAGMSDDLARLFKEEIRPRRGRSATIPDSHTKEADADNDRQEVSYVKSRVNHPAFVNDTNTDVDEKAGTPRDKVTTQMSRPSDAMEDEHLHGAQQTTTLYSLTVDTS